MATNLRRAKLQIHDISGMFRQAVVSFRANIPLFLTLALLSSIYETAIERSSLLSGLSFSSHNSSFSLQFSLDPKQRALYTPYKELNTSRFRKFGVVDSWFSRFLTSFLSPELDSTFQPSEEANQEGIPSAKLVGNDDANDGQNVPGSKSNGAVIVDDKIQQKDNKPDIREHETHGSNDNDEVSIVNNENENAEDGPQKRRLNGSQLDPDQSPSAKVFTESKDEKQVHQGKEDNDKSMLEDTLDSEEDKDSNDIFPRLKIETVSNVTKVSAHETVIDANELTFFSGKLLGGRGLDQGAMPQGGLTILLMLLLVAIAITIFLAMVGFQHALVLGSVAFSVVTTHMGKRASFVQSIKSSLKSNVGRLMWLAILHAALRGLESIFFMKTLFGSVMEMSEIEHLVLRLASTPFAFLAPVMDVDATTIGMAIRIGIYVGFDYVFDGIAYCIYVVACWVTIMERNYWGIGALSRSFNLVESMRFQAFIIRLVETIVCGRSFRWLLQQGIGQFGSAFVICTLQVYFLVLWLIFYISARSIHDRPANFSYRTLEDFLDRFK